MGPYSLLRLWRYINPLLTYLFILLLTCRRTNGEDFYCTTDKPVYINVETAQSYIVAYTELKFYRFPTY